MGGVAGAVYGSLRISQLFEQIQRLSQELAASNASHSEKAEALSQENARTYSLALEIARVLSESNQTLEDFRNKAYQWLQDNAYRYGFTLSYPKNNAYYIFEPWHWRYVGVQLATDLHSQNKHFYDLEQREIDEYLVNIFE